MSENKDLAQRIRLAAGKHNEPVKPVIHMVSAMSHRIDELEKQLDRTERHLNDATSVIKTFIDNEGCSDVHERDLTRTDIYMAARRFIDRLEHKR